MRIFPAFMTIPLSLGLLIMLLQGHAQAGSRSQQDPQAQSSATAVREIKSGPKVDRGLVIRTLNAHREDFKRRGFHTVATPLKLGERLPEDVESEQLPDTVKQALPRYEGYAWRRIGSDIVLIGIASNTFYDIFPNILEDDHTP